MSSSDHQGISTNIVISDPIVRLSRDKKCSEKILKLLIREIIFWNVVVIQNNKNRKVTSSSFISIVTQDAGFKVTLL